MAYWVLLKMRIRLDILRFKRWLNECRPIRAYRHIFLKIKKLPTYRFGKTAEGNIIECLLCKRISYNDMDIYHKFCVRCGIFHGAGKDEAKARLDLLKNIKDRS